jgi:hypothetical protein
MATILYRGSIQGLLDDGFIDDVEGLVLLRNGDGEPQDLLHLWHRRNALPEKLLAEFEFLWGGCFREWAVTVTHEDCPLLGGSVTVVTYDTLVERVDALDLVSWGRVDY